MSKKSLVKDATLDLNPSEILDFDALQKGMDDYIQGTLFDEPLGTDIPDDPDDLSSLKIATKFQV